MRDQLGCITSMDRKWAGVYLKELYQRLLQRGQMALVSEDTLSFYRHTGPDGEVRLPPMLTDPLRVESEWAVLFMSCPD